MGRISRRRGDLQKQAVDHSRQHRSISRYLSLHLNHRREEHHDHHLHFSLLSLAHALSPLARVPTTSSAETAVGVFESQRYLSIEANRLSDPHAEDYTAQFVALLHVSCDELLGCTQDVLKGVQAWFAEVRRGSFGSRARVQRIRAERLARLEDLSVNVKEALQRFKRDKRYVSLDLVVRACIPDNFFPGTESSTHIALHSIRSTFAQGRIIWTLRLTAISSIVTCISITSCGSRVS